MEDKTNEDIFDETSNAEATELVEGYIHQNVEEMLDLTNNLRGLAGPGSELEKNAVAIEMTIAAYLAPVVSFVMLNAGNNFSEAIRRVAQRLEKVEDLATSMANHFNECHLENPDEPAESVCGRVCH